MKLKKDQIRALATMTIVLVLYHVLAFVIPFPHKGPFWAGYIFGLIAILVQVPILLIAFRGADSPRSKFYGLPIARIGVIYLATQLAASFAAMAFGLIPGCPAWPFVLIFVLLLCAAALGTIATDATRDEIQRQDTVLKKDVSQMRALQSLGRMLTTQTEDDALKIKLQELSDALRFSDPVSGTATADAERELANLLDELQRALLEGDVSGASGLCKQAGAVLAERNRICKLNKNR